MWVADGRWEYGVQISAYGYDSELKSYCNLLWREGQIRQCLHFNWGWGGNCNGYFLLNVLDPNKADQYDLPSSSTKNTYDELYYITIH